MTLSLAYQNHVPSIPQLHLPVGGGTSYQEQQPGAEQGGGPFSSWRFGPATLVTRSLHDLSSLTHQNHAKLVKFLCGSNMCRATWEWMEGHVTEPKGLQGCTLPKQLNDQTDKLAKCSITIHLFKSLSFVA